MAEEGKEGKAEEAKKIVHTYPLVRVSHRFIDYIKRTEEPNILGIDM